MEMKTGTQCDYCMEYCEAVLFRKASDGYEEVICYECQKKEYEAGLPDDTTIYE